MLCIKSSTYLLDVNRTIYNIILNAVPLMIIILVEKHIMIILLIILTELRNVFNIN